jgi:hypothetical protein
LTPEHFIARKPTGISNIDQEVTEKKGSISTAFQCLASLTRSSLIVLINPNYDSIFKDCYLSDDKLDMDQQVWLILIWNMSYPVALK